MFASRLSNNHSLLLVLFISVVNILWSKWKERQDKNTSGIFFVQRRTLRRSRKRIGYGYFPISQKTISQNSYPVGFPCITKKLILISWLDISSRYQKGSLVKPEGKSELSTPASAANHSGLNHFKMGSTAEKGYGEINPVKPTISTHDNPRPEKRRREENFPACQGFALQSLTQTPIHSAAQPVSHSNLSPTLPGASPGSPSQLHPAQSLHTLSQLPLHSPSSRSGAFGLAETHMQCRQQLYAQLPVPATGAMVPPLTSHLQQFPGPLLSHPANLNSGKLGHFC